MFLLPPAIQRLLKERKGKKKRALALDVKMLTALHKAAEEQNRPEDEILADWLDSGVKHSSRNWTAEGQWDSLTRREREVLALVCLGNRNEDIAKELGISIPTVKTHLQNIFEKFGLRSKRELRQLLQDWDFVNWWNSRQM
jgi:DNA-binding CsgD family transcriptional regulator